MQKKYFSKYKANLLPFVNLVDNHLKSYERFIKTDVPESLSEIFPIESNNNDRFRIDLISHNFHQSVITEKEARENKLTYQNRLKVKLKLTNREFGSAKEQEIIFAEIPAITQRGTFIINGVEKVIIPQIIKSHGVIFEKELSKGSVIFSVKVKPARGSWVDIICDVSENILMVKINKKRKFPLTVFLKAVYNLTEEQILSLFKDEKVLEYIKNTLEKDKTSSIAESKVELYKKIKDDALIDEEDAEKYIDYVFLGELYDLSKNARVNFNRRFNLAPITRYSKKDKILSIDEYVLIINELIRLQENLNSKSDDVDHLGTRRLRFLNEMLNQKFKVGLTRIKRNVIDKMSIIDLETSMPFELINTSPLQSLVKEFFNLSQFSQMLDQNNLLYELENTRKITATGPGGLVAKRAGFEVRDTHMSHYGRICPVQTAEGPTAGLVLHLSMYARINDLGIIETPYAKVKNRIITSEIVYLDAFSEEDCKIASYDIEIENQKIKNNVLNVRYKGGIISVNAEDVQLIDVSANQAYSVSTSMIPFVNHNDGHRALMGSNMQKQAIPSIKPQFPLVATGIEEYAAINSNRLSLAEEAGVVIYADSKKVTIKEDKTKKNKDYIVLDNTRSNSFTILSQRPVVKIGDKVKKGQILAECNSTQGGQIAVGQNLFTGIMLFDGHNYEDAILISKKVVADERFTTTHIDERVTDVRETRLGAEEVTADIPNVSELKLKHLDERGIIRVGSYIKGGEILIGKITPKGEVQLSPEERLLRSIFGEKSREFKDTSLYASNDLNGRVIGVKIFSRKNNEVTEPGVIQRIYIQIARISNIEVGDKLSGRHGNKGVVSKVVNQEDMPFTKEGESLEIILTPLGIPSRMNIGQILEMHLGYAAKKLGYQAITPPFLSATPDEVRNELIKAGIPSDGQIDLFDGRTGEKFDNKIAVGYMYILKLHHMVSDKIKMRSTGEYSLVTQIPVKGKSGGKRIGEMEVWALIAYGAAHTLREILTIRSNDIIGRQKVLDAIVRKTNKFTYNTPITFNVLAKTLMGLGLKFDYKNKND